MRGEGPSAAKHTMRQAARATAAATHESRMRAIILEHSDYRALKFDVARRELTDVVAELQAHSCSVEGTEPELKERLLRKLLMRIPALARRVPWYAVDEARTVDRKTKTRRSFWKLSTARCSRED